VVESSTFRILNAFNPRREGQGQKQSQHPVPSRDFSLGPAVLLERPKGRGVRNCVKTLERGGFRSGVLAPGGVLSRNYARLKDVLATDTKGALDIGWPGFHRVPAVLPPTRRSMFSSSRARGGQAGGS